MMLEWKKKIGCPALLAMLLFGLVACEQPEVQPVDVQYTDSTILFSVGGVSFTMIRVEGGTFVMGATEEQGQSEPDPNEYPPHRVQVETFYIAQTEVTQELWTAVMHSNPSRMHGEENLPADCIKWDKCQDFISALNRLTGGRFAFRMPTEQEWEFAARGGNRSKGCKYAGSDEVGLVAWYEDNSDGRTHPVATKQPNELGLYDMSGNLWEWCSDWLAPYPSDTTENTASAHVEGGHRVMRGGSWTYDASFCRVSRRNYSSNVIVVSNCGLRLAL